MNTRSASIHLCAITFATLTWSGCVAESLSLGDGMLDGAQDDAGASDDTQLRWSERFPDRFGRDITVAPDGTFYVLGWLKDFDATVDGFENNLWLARFDAEGEPMWEITEPLAEETLSPRAVAADATGVYAVLSDFGVGELRRLDFEGNALWSVPVSADIINVEVVPGGGAIVMGSQGAQGWAQRFGADGSPGWSRTFGDPAVSQGRVRDLAFTSNDGVALSGEHGTGDMRGRAWVTELDLADGADRWELALEGSFAYDVDEAADGSLLVVGSLGIGQITQAPDGTHQSTWDDVSDGSWSLVLRPDGSFVMAGNLDAYQDVSECDPECRKTMHVEAFTPDRTSQWRVEDPTCSTPQAMVATADGGMLVVAECYTDVALEHEMRLFRFEP